MSLSLYVCKCVCACMCVCGVKSTCAIIKPCWKAAEVIGSMPPAGNAAAPLPPYPLCWYACAV